VLFTPSDQKTDWIYSTPLDPHKKGRQIYSVNQKNFTILACFKIYYSQTEKIFEHFLCSNLRHMSYFIILNFEKVMPFVKKCQQKRG